MVTGEARLSVPPPPLPHLHPPGHYAGCVEKHLSLKGLFNEKAGPGWGCGTRITGLSGENSLSHPGEGDIRNQCFPQGPLPSEFPCPLRA